jgi:hypothetical protein
VRYLDHSRGLGYDPPRMAHAGQVLFGFPGDSSEALALTSAVSRYCKDAALGAGHPQKTASPDGDHCNGSGTVGHCCAAHSMLLDQKIVGRLVFEHRIAEKLLLEEFGPGFA